MRHLIDVIMGWPLWVWVAAAALAPLVAFIVWLDAIFIHPEPVKQTHRYPDQEDWE
jgi:hypothetical protein